MCSSDFLLNPFSRHYLVDLLVTDDLIFRMRCSKVQSYIDELDRLERRNELLKEREVYPTRFPAYERHRDDVAWLRGTGFI
jgi:hypothetical protein